MKKFFSLSLCFICVLLLGACEKKTSAIILPPTDKIISINITVGENTINHSDKAWISAIITDISASVLTNKESFQDVPRAERYIKIDFKLDTEISTFFAYEDGDKYYIEKPYQGIYKIDRQLFESLQETG